MSKNYIFQKEELLTKLRAIADATAEETLLRIETMPAKELVALLSTSTQLASILEKEIRDDEKRVSEDDPNRTIDVKYNSLNINESKVINMLLN